MQGGAHGRRTKSEISIEAGSRTILRRRRHREGKHDIPAWRHRRTDGG